MLGLTGPRSSVDAKLMKFAFAAPVDAFVRRLFEAQRAILLEAIRLLILVQFQPAAIGILKFDRCAVACFGLPFDGLVKLPEFGVRSSEGGHFGGTFRQLVCFLGGFERFLAVAKLGFRTTGEKQCETCVVEGGVGVFRREIDGFFVIGQGLAVLLL
jgi:hypothetical protein